MHGDVEALFKNILNIFMQSSTINNCKSGTDLLKISIIDKGNYIKTKDIVIGLEARASIAKLKKLSSGSLMRINLLQTRTNLCNLIDPANNYITFEIRKIIQNMLLF